MTVINRQFYQTWRGPGPADQDSWSLLFDEETRRLLVRHEWRTSRNLRLAFSLASNLGSRDRQSRSK